MCVGLPHTGGRRCYRSGRRAQPAAAGRGWRCLGYSGRPRTATCRRRKGCYEDDTCLGGQRLQPEFTRRVVDSCIAHQICPVGAVVADRPVSRAGGDRQYQCSTSAAGRLIPIIAVSSLLRSHAVTLALTRTQQSPAFRRSSRFTQLEQVLSRATGEVRAGLLGGRFGNRAIGGVSRFRTIGGLLTNLMGLGAGFGAAQTGSPAGGATDGAVAAGAGRRQRPDCWRGTTTYEDPLPHRHRKA